MKENKITPEELHKELDQVQEIIKRMANNSFLLKGWMITIFTSAVIFFEQSESSNNLNISMYTILFLIISFWYLDAFFLHKERCYIALYNHKISNTDRNKRTLYSLDYKPFRKSQDNIFRLMLNKTILPFYFIPVILTVIITWMAYSE